MAIRSSYKTSFGKEKKMRRMNPRRQLWVLLAACFAFGTSAEAETQAAVTDLAAPLIEEDETLPGGTALGRTKSGMDSKMP